MNTNKLLTIVAGTLMCAAALFFSSCSKHPKGSYTVMGKIMDSCLAGKPFADKDIVLSITVIKPAFDKETYDSIGVGKTDAEGNFNIICQNWGGGEIRIKSKNSYSAFNYMEVGNSQSTKKSMEGQTFDLGTMCIHD